MINASYKLIIDSTLNIFLSTQLFYVVIHYLIYAVQTQSHVLSLELLKFV